MMRHTEKVYGKDVHYWPEEVKPLWVTGTCTRLSIEYSRDANIRRVTGCTTETTEKGRQVAPLSVK